MTDIIHLIDKQAGLSFVTVCGKIGHTFNKKIKAVLATDTMQGPTCPDCRRIANSRKKRVSSHTR